jgi:hypothetical protein
LQAETHTIFRYSGSLGTIECLVQSVGAICVVLLISAKHLAVLLGIELRNGRKDGREGVGTLGVHTVA